jgi:hypothetical protein
MKVVTLLTPSHKPFLDQYFIPSFPTNPNLELVIKFKDQKCPSAEFEKDGWHETMKLKAECFYEELLKCKEGEKFIFSDPDIQFFDDFYQNMMDHSEGYDVVFQNDVGGGVNTGWFIAENNERSRFLFRAILEYLPKFSNEQKAASEFCFNKNKYLELRDLKWNMLPLDEYWTYGVYRKTWDGETAFKIPSDSMIMHHANWVTGVPNKLKMLEYVKKSYN